jgi:hypothetical protein
MKVFNTNKILVCLFYLNLIFGGKRVEKRYSPKH